MTANAALILAGLGTPSLSWFAPLGTTLPTNATTALAVAYKDAGWVAESGADISYAAEKVDIEGYGSMQPARTIVTKETLSVKVIFRETNVVSQAVYRRLALASVTVTSATGALSVTDGPARSIEYVGVLDSIDGLNKVRKVFPRLTPVSRDNEQISRAQNMAYGVTLDALPDASGNTCYTHYILDALKSA